MTERYWRERSNIWDRFGSGEEGAGRRDRREGASCALRWS